ncbi:MAG: hypothetical protein R3D00_20405 [Bacteroidia bacterium]
MRRNIDNQHICGGKPPFLRDLAGAVTIGGKLFSAFYRQNLQKIDTPMEITITE